MSVKTTVKRTLCIQLEDVHNSSALLCNLKGQGIGQNNFAAENGNHKQAMRHLPAPWMKELDSSLSTSDTKSPKRGGILGYGSHEKQVWIVVQKSGSSKS